MAEGGYAVIAIQETYQTTNFSSSNNLTIKIAKESFTVNSMLEET
jgi:hypothetical protein